MTKSYPHLVNASHLQHIKVNLNNTKENQNQSKNVILRKDSPKAV